MNEIGRGILLGMAAIAIALSAICIGAAIAGCGGSVEEPAPVDTCAQYAPSCMADCEDAGGTECARACAAVECP